MSQQPGTPTLIRDMNRQTVLRIIEDHGPISRADIARKVGLSSPTVSAAVEYLLRQRLVLEVGPGESSGGRRPKMLTFNPGAGYVLGIDLGGKSLTATLSDLGGNTIRKEVGPRIDTELGANVVGPVKWIASRLLDESGIDDVKVLGIGIAAPGVTDPDNGVVSLAPVLGWEEFPLRDVLAREFGIPVVVENDVNAAALGEKLFGAGKQFDDFVFVFIGSGIGAGIIINGELYRGHKNLAGEIGYLVIDPCWVQSKTPGFGCLESLASESAILQKAAERLDVGLSDVLLNPPGADSLRLLFHLASSGHEAVSEIVRDAARYLAMGLANLLWVLSPRAIILGGMVTHEGGEMLVDLIRENLAAISPRMPELRVSQLGKDAGALGATSIAVQEVKRRLLDETFSASFP